MPGLPGILLTLLAVALYSNFAGILKAVKHRIEPWQEVPVKVQAKSAGKTAGNVSIENPGNIGIVHAGIEAVYLSWVGENQKAGKLLLPFFS